MIYAISPIHTNKDFENHFSLDDKIEVFIARIEGWQLGVAQAIVDSNIQHRGFALLQILTNYFEMVAKYADGFISEGKSKYYFKQGLRMTFPDIEPEAEDLLEAFYQNIRNGLYHAGITRRVILSNDIPGSIGYLQEHNLIALSPDKMVQDLIIRFRSFAADLRETKHITLRANFEKRFDYDNEW